MLILLALSNLLLSTDGYVPHKFLYVSLWSCLVVLQSNNPGPGLHAGSIGPTMPPFYKIHRHSLLEFHEHTRVLSTSPLYLKTCIASLSIVHHSPHSIVYNSNSSLQSTTSMYPYRLSPATVDTRPFDPFFSSSPSTLIGSSRASYTSSTLPRMSSPASSVAQRSSTWQDKLQGSPCFY